MPYAKISSANIYYETAGTGTPFVMIHAGVADCRQWNLEFDYFAHDYRAIRHDMRGFGLSEPVDGEFRPIDDLTELLTQLDVTEPAIMMGCSMGGGLAMDFTLSHPSRVRALIMVGSGPSGLQLDVPSPEKFKQVEEADKAGDLDLVCELETQIWFDGEARSPEQVNPHMRQLAYDMNHRDLEHDAKGLGKRQPNISPSASERLGEINVPVLIIVGEHDLAYMHGAADHMAANLKKADVVKMRDAAHLPNMDHPEEFRQIVTTFLETI